MSKDYSIGEITPEEISKVVLLINEVFDKFIAPGYSEEGIHHFKEFNTIESLQRRLTQNSFMLVARHENQIIGVTEFRNDCHIRLLFTDEAWHSHGVARTLINSAIIICLQENKDIKKITVNSSPFAVPIYEKLGFTATGPERAIDGMCFTPMVLAL